MSVFSKFRGIFYVFVNSVIRFDHRLFFSCSMSQIFSKSVHFPHPIGIVIGGGREATRIDDGVTILQNVTIGVKDVNYRFSGGDPIIRIESGVVICAGAVVLGPVVIGRNSTIAANSVVLTDVPPNSIYGGVPARLLKKLE